MTDTARELRRASEWAMPKPDLNRLLHRAADEIDRIKAEFRAYRERHPVQVF